MRDCAHVSKLFHLVQNMFCMQKETEKAIRISHYSMRAFIFGKLLESYSASLTVIIINWKDKGRVSANEKD